MNWSQEAPEPQLDYEFGSMLNSDESVSISGDIWMNAMRAAHNGSFAGINPFSEDDTSQEPTVIAGLISSLSSLDTGSSTIFNSQLSERPPVWSQASPSATDGAGNPTELNTSGEGYPQLSTGEDTPLEPTDQAQQTIVMSNGDQIIFNGSRRFAIVDAQGNEVTKGQAVVPPMTDVGVTYPLSNGAEYHTRGTWNHNESITYPNGDEVRFTDTGKILSTTINGVETNYEVDETAIPGSGLPGTGPPQQGRGPR